MKAAVLKGTKQLEVMEWEYPSPLAKEVIVKVTGEYGANGKISR
jgi:L-iditol 2-dehydrogenase